MSREELIQALSCAQKSIDVHQRLLATLRPTEPPIDVRVQALVQAQTDLQNVLTNITLVVSTLSQEVSRLIVAVGQDSEKDVAKLSLCFNCDTRGHALSDCTQARLDSTVAALNLPKNQQKRALRAAQRERLRMASAAAAGAPKTPASAPAAVAASQQFAASTSENLRPLMPIDVSDGKRKRTLDAVIASGADVNVILVATANQFQAARRDTRSVSLQGMTGAFQSRGAIALTVSTAAGVSAVLWFHMVDTYPHDMMIGSGGMSLLKISLVATASDVNLVASPPAGGGKAVSFPLRDMGPDEPVAFLSVYLAK